MDKKGVILGHSGLTDKGVTIHLNKKMKLKSGTMSSNIFWVSWDKIGKSLFEDYTDEDDVDKLNELRNAEN